MTDHDESCTCGENHDALLRESMPEMMVLRLANEMVNEKDYDLSRAMGTVAESLSGDDMDRLMMYAQIEGMSPKEAVHNYGAAMLVRGIFMGCVARNFYGDKFGTVDTPTEEEVEAALEFHYKKEAERAERMEGMHPLDPNNLPEEIRKQLEEAGHDLSKIGVMVMEVPREEFGRFQKQPESASDEPPAPGMYL